MTTRTWLTILVSIGALLNLAAVRTGFLLDDFLHRSMLRGTFPVPRHPLDLYNFVDDSNRAEMIARGIVPWWTSPELTIRFFRPLSSALIWLDDTLFGDSALAMHLHSLAWWAALIVAAFVLYRAYFGERVARIASLVLALAPCHAMPLAWLANRDALISLGLGIPALYAYTRSRATRSPRDVALTTLLFSLAFLGGEYTLSFAAYVLTFELVRRDDRLVQRLLGMMPFVVPGAIYMLVRGMLRYGTAGSGFYNDPFRSPELFLFFAPRRMGTLILEAWLGLDNDTITWGTPWWVVIGGAALLGLVVLRVARHVLDAGDADVRRAAAWLGIGSFIALVPVLAVVPSQRVLGAVMFGVAPVVALVIDGAWFPKVVEPRRGWAEATQLTALCLGFAHFVHGPVNTVLLDLHFRESALAYERQMETLGAAIARSGGADPVVVRGSGVAFFAPFGLNEDAEPPPRFAVLSWTSHVLALRTGERALDLFSASDNGLFPWAEGNLYLDTGWTVSEGDVFEAPGYTATITRVVDGRTTGVHFEFEEDFDRRLWVNETPKAYYVAPPAPEGSGRLYESDR